MIRFIVLSLGVLTCLASLGTRELQADQDKRQAIATPAKPPRIVVVVSKKNPVESLTSAELARIFLRTTNYWSNGSSITVFERPIKEKIRQRFSEQVLRKKPEALREYWMNIELTKGVRPPKVLRSQKLVKRYLERVKGGIAYLYEHEIDDTVKVVEIRQ